MVISHSLDLTNLKTSFSQDINVIDIANVLHSLFTFKIFEVWIYFRSMLGKEPGPYGASVYYAITDE